MDGFMFEDTDDFELQNVFDHFQDDESRELYITRSIYSLTGDRDVLREQIRSMDVAKLLLRRVKGLDKGKKIALFGLGEWGTAVYDLFPELNITYFIDNKKAGSLWKGNIVHSVDIIKNEKNVFVIVAVLFDYVGIKNQLLSFGYSEEDFILLGEETVKRQYFDLPALKFGENESFVDVGGYDGETSVNFSRIVDGQYNHIYCLEPAKEFWNHITLQTQKLERFSLIKKGASKNEAVVKFMNLEDTSHMSIDDNEFEEFVNVDSLDNILKNKEVTYIKMDIEGMEISALLGAINIIKLQRPKLAISVYHRRRDIWDIPKLLLKINARYKFYLRMYSFKGNDVVLYAL